MKFVSYLLFLLILSMNACSVYQPKEEDKVLNEIIKNVSNDLQERYGLYLSALGGGSDKGIWLITAYFDIYHPLDQKEARYLIVKIVEKFLEEVNISESIRSYLKNYPFTAQNLRIFIISFESENRKQSLDPYISGLYQDGGFITYLTLNPENTHEFKTRIVEPYTEALAIVQQEENLKNKTQDAP